MVLEYDIPASVSQQDGNRSESDYDRMVSRWAEPWSGSRVWEGR